METNPAMTVRQLQLENEELKARLAEAEETLDAIRNGEVDAIVVSGPDGEKIFSLSSAETPYRIIIEEMNEGAVVLSAEGLILFCNRRFAELLSVPAEQIVGSYLTRFVAEKERKKCSEMLQAGLNGRCRGEFTYPFKDSRLVHFSFSFSPLPPGLLGDVCIMTADISELKEKEAELRIAYDTLDEQVKNRTLELEQLIYVTCHDLRTPLVTIEGFSDVLENSVEEILSVLEHEGLSSATKAKLASSVIDIRESRSYIRNGVSKMTSLLKGLSQVSRVGRVEINKEEIDMNRLIAETLAENEFHRKVQGGRIEIADLPSCLGDPGQISQLFANLIGNALKYSKPDQPCIIKITGKKDADHSVYCVEDNGIGIAPEDQNKVFEMFYQLNPKMTGEGLGLNIASKVVERHNGRIWVESEFGKGSLFYVAL